MVRERLRLYGHQPVEDANSRPEAEGGQGSFRIGPQRGSDNRADKDRRGRAVLRHRLEAGGREDPAVSRYQ